MGEAPLFTQLPRRRVLGNWASGIRDSRKLIRSRKHKKSRPTRASDAMRLPCFSTLLVPRFDVHLTHDLAVTHLQRLRGENLKPLRVLTCLVERYAVLAYDLVLDAVRHVSAANIFETFGDRLLAAQHLRRARRSNAVDTIQLGVFVVELHERVEVALLDRAAQGLEIEPIGGLLFGHDISFPPTFCKASNSILSEGARHNFYKWFQRVEKLPR